MRDYVLNRDVWRRMDTTLTADLRGTAMVAFAGRKFLNLVRMVELGLASWWKKVESDGGMVSGLVS